ncbi:hypothetical protein BDZ91DRAFT_734863 [Kalaharituber pfeilii]|nr:hypothetical protein BDZ91DRAFT_734863 [Kalaharituber pfeilii]
MKISAAFILLGLACSTRASPIASPTFEAGNYVGVLGLDEAATNASNEALRKFQVPGTTPIEEGSPLTKRDYIGTVCNISGNWVPTHEAVNEVQYLESIASKSCGAPPHSCSRVACSYGTAVFFCNDWSETRVMICGTIAGGARNVVNDCSIGGRTLGMATYTDGFNVQVKASNC